MWFERILLKRKLASPDVIIRQSAVASLDAAADKIILFEMARGDQDARVRSAAIVRLREPARLIELQQCEADPEVRHILAAHLDEIYGEQALSACAEGRECDAFERIADENRLIAIALRSGAPHLMLAAAARLRKNKQRWLDLLSRVTDDQVALEIYSRSGIDENSEAADFLYNNAASMALRSRISSARQARQAAAEAYAAELALVEAAEACALAPNEARFNELAVRWSELRSGNEALKNRFLAARYRHTLALEKQQINAQTYSREYELAGKLLSQMEHLQGTGDAKSFSSLVAAWQNANLNNAPGAADFKDRFSELSAQWQAFYAAQAQAQAQALSAARDILARFMAFKEVRPVPAEAERAALLAEFAELESKLSDMPMEMLEIKGALLAAERELARRARGEEKVRDLARWEHFTLKMDICSELEKLSGVPDNELPEAAHRFRILRERWNSIGSVPPEKLEELRQRYQLVCSQLYARMDQYFSARDAERTAAEAAKLEILAEAETLSGSEDWSETSNRLKELQAAWKAAGTAAPARERELFARFHAACDAFFVRRNAVWEARKRAFQAAAAGKQQLCNAADALKDKPFEVARAEIAKLRETWKTLPSAGKDDRLLYMQFNRIIDEIYAAHREANDEARRQQEIACTYLSELLQKARNNELSLAEIENQLASNQRQWESIEAAPTAEIDAERDKLLSEINNVAAEIRHQAAMYNLDQAEQLESVTECDDAPEKLIDHLGRRLKVCGELEERLKECRIIAGDGDLASELESAIVGNFNREQRELTVAELDEFLQRFVAVGSVPPEARSAVFDRFRTLYLRALDELQKKA